MLSYFSSGDNPFPLMDEECLRWYAVTLTKRGAEREKKRMGKYSLHSAQQKMQPVTTKVGFKRLNELSLWSFQLKLNQINIIVNPEISKINLIRLQCAFKHTDCVFFVFPYIVSIIKITILYNKQTIAHLLIPAQ